MIDAMGGEKADLIICDGAPEGTVMASTNALNHG